MAYKDLREWLAGLDELGELKRIQGIRLEELGPLWDIAYSRENVPSLLCENIQGFSPEYRLAIPGVGRGNTSLTLGLPIGAAPLELINALRAKMQDVGRIPPKFVETGPVLENVRMGDDVDLMAFPVPVWHELDGGPYIGTSDIVITRDPDEGWVNVGTYRVQRHDKNTLGFYVSPGKHARIQREKYWAKGEPCPVAMCFGQDPLLFYIGSAALPWGISEYDYAGGLKGEPIEVIKGPVTGLPIPAYAEVVIEGEAYPGETRVEGPFGEFTGYYGSGEREEPVVRVKSVLHRTNPIMLVKPPIRPRGGPIGQTNAMRAATVWNALERTGIPDIVGVGCYMEFFFTVVSIRQLYPGHSRQVGAVAGQIPGAAYCGRWVIVVDDDIDPTNFDQVMWALATRCDPALSIDFLHRCWSTPLDPMSNTGLTSDGPRVFNSRAIIDACIPYELKSRGLFPPVFRTDKEVLAEVRAKYGSLLD